MKKLIFLLLLLTLPVLAQNPVLRQRWTTNTDSAKIDGSNLTNFNASQLTSGTIPTNRYGRFLSTNIVLTAGVYTYTVPHGLGVGPAFVQGNLVCVTNDAASHYVVGDVVYNFIGVQNTTGGAIAYSSDATTVSLQTPTPLVGNEGQYQFAAKGGGISAVTSYLNFRLQLVAWP